MFDIYVNWRCIWIYVGFTDKKKDKKKKRVHFADDVVDPIGNGKDYRRKVLLRYYNKRNKGNKEWQMMAICVDDAYEDIVVDDAYEDIVVELILWHLACS